MLSEKHHRVMIDLIPIITLYVGGIFSVVHNIKITDMRTSFLRTCHTKHDWLPPVFFSPPALCIFILVTC